MGYPAGLKPRPAVVHGRAQRTPERLSIRKHGRPLL
jgi:hypothetical protein